MISTTVFAVKFGPYANVIGNKSERDVFRLFSVTISVLCCCLLKHLSAIARPGPSVIYLWVSLSFFHTWAHFKWVGDKCVINYVQDACKLNGITQAVSTEAKSSSSCCFPDLTHILIPEKEINFSLREGNIELFIKLLSRTSEHLSWMPLSRFHIMTMRFCCWNWKTVSAQHFSHQFEDSKHITLHVKHLPWHIHCRDYPTEYHQLISSTPSHTNVHIDGITENMKTWKKYKWHQWINDQA